MTLSVEGSCNELNCKQLLPIPGMHNLFQGYARKPRGVSTGRMDFSERFAPVAHFLIQVK